MSKHDFYWKLFNAYKLAFTDIKNKNVQQKANDYWNKVKDQPNLEETILNKISELKQRHGNTSISRFLIKSPADQVASSRVTKERNAKETNKIVLPELPGKFTESQKESNCILERATPRQSVLQKEIATNLAELERLEKIQNSGWADEKINETIDTLKRKQSKLSKDLKLRINNTKYNREHRARKKQKYESLQKQHPEEDLVKPGPGRYPLEHKQPELLKAIVDIVEGRSKTDDRRRCEVLRTCQTLQDLHRELEDRGFVLSTTALYHRLLPKNFNSTEGKRHVTTVPVKLIKATASGRKHHQDSHFAMATVNYLKDLAAILGSGPVFFLSQDDKCRVPIGLPAATKQAPFLMMMTQRVKLPDHDFVVAGRHKLIPSVYAAAKIDSNGVSYSGPTFIAIRSGKHDKSTASTHSFDFKSLFDLTEFDCVLKTSNGMMKPVVIVSVDGGPDENPRFESVQSHAIDHFINYDLDAMFVVTHAPGQSAYNIVERRMAPLSHDLAGIILEHDHFGTHLNKSLKCIDLELEKKNFANAGNSLAQVWSQTIIDSHPVVARYVHPEEEHPVATSQTEAWRSVHVRTSQYLLQIVKCKDESCCNPYRCNINQLLPKRFLPTPILYAQNEQGIVACNEDNIESGHFGSLYKRMFLSSILPNSKFKILPFDFYCPSVQSSINNRICKKCHLYFCSAKFLNNHKRYQCEPFQSDDEESDNEELNTQDFCEIEFDEFEVPIFTMEQFLSPLYESVTN